MFLWDRWRSVTQVGQSEYLYSRVWQLVNRLAKDPNGMNLSPFSVIDMGIREVRGLFLQLLSQKVIKAWSFPWVTLVSNAGACWERHCRWSKAKRGRRDGKSPDDDVAGTLDPAISKNHCGSPRAWAMLRKPLVECLYIFIYWFNLLEDGFLLLKTWSSVQYLWVFYWDICSQYGLCQGAAKLCLRKGWGYFPLTTQRHKCRGVNALILKAGLPLLQFSMYYNYRRANVSTY